METRVTNQSFQEHGNLERVIIDAQSWFAAHHAAFETAVTYPHDPGYVSIRLVEGPGAYNQQELKALTFEFMAQHDNSAQ